MNIDIQSHEESDRDAFRHTSTEAKRRRVLIVDDEPDLIRTVGLRLMNAGYDVLGAPDGIVATALAINESPDVILMDIGLPAGDGHAVTKRLNNNIRTMGIPVIYLTARTGRQDVEMAIENRAFAYLVKPCDPAELLEMVSQAVERPKRAYD